MANQYPLNYVSNHLNAMLAQFLTEYSQEADTKAKEITEKVANDFAQKLREKTPRSDRGTEHLADTVKVTKISEKSYGRDSEAQIVHYGKWQIAHLLEFGYTLRNGNRITRHPFIRPLFDENKEKYYKMYEEGMKK